MYKLHLRYLYTFYNFDNEEDSKVIDETVDVEENKRFTLYQQEDSSFIMSGVKTDFVGKYVVVTFPNKDNILVYENEDTELVLDEYFDSMGANNHNIYEGYITLEKA